MDRNNQRNVRPAKRTELQRFSLRIDDAGQKILIGFSFYECRSLRNAPALCRIRSEELCDVHR